LHHQDQWEVVDSSNEIGGASDQQHKVWDPGGLRQMKSHDQEIMKHFNPRSFMQEHFASKTI